MSKKPQQTVLTVEYFHNEIIPVLEAMMNKNKEEIKSELIVEIKTEVKDELSSELREYHNDVISFKEEVMSEIKDFREEISVSNHQKERNEKRLDRIEDVLHLPQIDF